MIDDNTIGLCNRIREAGVFDICDYFIPGVWKVDISDLIYFVDYNFNGGPPPLVLNFADVDGSCSIDIADVVYLVDYMFSGGPPLVMGCVE